MNKLSKNPLAFVGTLFVIAAAFVLYMFAVFVVDMNDFWIYVKSDTGYRTIYILSSFYMGAFSFYIFYRLKRSGIAKKHPLFILMSIIFVFVAAFVFYLLGYSVINGFYDYLTMEGMILYIAAVLYMIFFSAFFFFVRKKLDTRITRFKNLFLLMILPIMSLIVLIYCFGTASNIHFIEYNHISIWKIGTVLCLSALITAAVTTLIEIKRASKANELKIETLVNLKEYEMYRQQINDANQYIEEIAAIKHNMKNKIFCISELLSNNNISEAVRLCDNIKSELDEVSYIFHTDNLYLNAILNVLYKKSKETNTDMKAVIKSSLKNIDSSDLISLIGNLCDNAIEALQKNNNQRILKLSLSEKGGYYILSVKNNIDSSVMTGNPDLNSSKQDKLYHGFGLKTVKSIVKKYDGVWDISEEDGFFAVGIMLKIPSTTE